MRSLMWFRSDLRLADNPALTAAVTSGDHGTVAVFVCCPEQWLEHDWGAPKVDFLLRNLEDLSRRLEQLGVPLLVLQVDLFAEVPNVLLEVAREHDCEALFFNREYEVNERRRDEEVSRHFGGAGLEVRASDDQTIIEPAALRTTQGTFYTVFTPFYRSWVRSLEESGIPELEPSPGSRRELPCQPSTVPTVIEGFAPANGRFESWQAGEEAARRRLERFLEARASQYPESRDVPSEEATSSLSPYLALGVISARTCLWAAAEANKGQLTGGEKGLVGWIRQLVWREFYRHVLVGYPRVSMNRAFKAETERIAWRHDETAFHAWSEGRIGVPFIDAGMRQLRESGWMHNRLRMVTAMFLTKDLLIDWRWGERFFMQHLVDGDLANNNGGWQWSASTGTDAAPYFRIFNPWTQGRRYDPDGKFIRRWVPELAGIAPSALHDPKRLADALPAKPGYPRPLVNHASARVRALEAFQATS
ncbi:MAG: deoxyribodipyrimidine photo-lyase [Thermoanaerobaculia bacterium]